MNNFWKESEYARREYVGKPPSDELISSVEKELGYTLPASYIALMKIQNGGVLLKNCFPLSCLDAENYIAINGIYGIDREKSYSLCGSCGNQFRLTEWVYPDIGIYICDCPSAGHDMIALDYRKCGKNGEPEVVHVDQERDYKITFLAKDFESFINGLVNKKI